MTKLIAFDGDYTLWTPLDGVCLSDRTPYDVDGWPHFSFSPTGDPLVVEREDGVRFQLRAEAREVLATLRDSGVLTGVVSYNHEGNVKRILEAFGIRAMFDYVVGEWHTHKDSMLDRMRAEASAAGHSVLPEEVLLVDDDPESLYVRQCARAGMGFRRFGVEIQDLREVLPLAGVSSRKVS